MLKLLIVDDEPIILEGLQKTIDWEKCGFEVVGTAENGMIAFEKIKQLSPDVVITDIRMNYMDGLELIRKTKETLDNVSFVVLSAYSDFDYAKEACDLGAFSYILKPFEEEQILNVMSSLKNKILKAKDSEEKMRHMTRLLKEQEKEIEQWVLRKIFKKQLTDEEIDNRVSLININLSNDKQYVVALIRIDEIRESVWGKDNDIAIFAIRKLAVEIFENEFSISSIYLDEENAGLLICCENISDDTIKRIDELLMRILKYINEFLGIVVSISKGSCHYGYRGISESYNEACKAMELSYIFGTNSLLDIKQTGISVNSSYRYPDKIEYNIINSIKRNDLKSFKNEILNFINFFKNENNCYAHISFSLQCLFVSIVKVFVESDPELISKYSDIASFVEKIHKLPINSIVQMITDFTWEFIKKDINNKYNCMHGFINDVIKIAINYIEKNIGDCDLTIKKVSDEVHLNPVYFGRLFKKELDKSFTEYVSEVRVEMAKKLLAETNLKVFEVAEEVGIDNLPYFNVLFKKYTGLTPIEYKNEVMRKL